MTFFRAISAAAVFSSVAALAADPHPPGTRVAAMVVQVASLDELMASGDQGMLGRLREHGIADEELSDGSVAAGIVYCCGGGISKETMLVFYVPLDFRVTVGDVVEVSLGRVPTKKQRKKGDNGAINQALGVRGSFNDDSGTCRWDPENDTLWMRVLYCDWMLPEGWEYRGGLSKGWYRASDPD